MNEIVLMVDAKLNQGFALTNEGDANEDEERELGGNVIDEAPAAADAYIPTRALDLPARVSKDPRNRAGIFEELSRKDSTSALW